MLLNLHGGIRADIMFLSTSFDIPICHGDKKPIYLIWKIYALWIKTTNLIRCSKSRSLNEFSFFFMNWDLKVCVADETKRGKPCWLQTLHVLAPPLCPPPPKKNYTWHLTHDTWHATPDTLHMTHDTWHMTHDTWHMTLDTWHMTHDTWHMTQKHDTWHMTHDTWHMTHDTWHMTHGGRWIFSHEITTGTDMSCPLLFNFISVGQALYKLLSIEILVDDWHQTLTSLQLLEKGPKLVMIQLKLLACPPGHLPYTL